MSSWGAGRGNGSGRGSRGRRMNGRGICRNLGQSGGCRFGDSCKFSHDANDSSQYEGRRERSPDTPENLQAREGYNSWKRLIKREPRPNDIETITAVWTGALEILNSSDRNWKQMLPRDLDDDDNYGREHIHAVMSMRAGPHARATFVELAISFLRTMTHTALLDCLSVDTPVGNLYNYICGSNGNRAITFFENFITNIIEAHSIYTLPKVSAEMALASISTSLLEILRREKRAAFNDDVSNLVDSLHNTMDVIDIAHESVAFQQISNTVVELKAVIARAHGLLKQQEEPEEHEITFSVVQRTYPRKMTTPGGRHNNDHVDITNIQLLPTEEEIRNDLPEFLPSTNRDEPHFLADQAERHLDTHFRLLRHDIFGELKEALAGLLNSMSTDTISGGERKINLGNIRAYHYTNAHIAYVSFDQRRGLQPHVSFNQQHSLRKKSSLEKRNWWEESKRLEEGVLLCFVYAVAGRSSLLFLTVSEKRTDPKKDYSLSSEDHQPTIITKFTGWNESDLEKMIQLSSQKTKGILIEFPGILPATFAPILETLQNMQRKSIFPFRKWVLPSRIMPGVRSESSGILPPLYARASNFDFCLDSLLNDGLGPLSINPRSLDNDAIIDVLENRTGLDRGQSQALLAALTREFVVIQGPPGTGKSHLGLYLMRVLLAAKSKANLGPIIVVCYTNHALDQFLEHLDNIGIERIIRIGGQSRSKVLEGKNLRVVSKDEGKTGFEGYSLAMIYNQLDDLNGEIKRALGRFYAAQKPLTHATLHRHLQHKYPRIFSQFSRFDDENFEKVGAEPLDIWLREIQGYPIENDMTMENKRYLLGSAEIKVESLSTLDKSRLVGYWAKEIREDLSNNLYEMVKRANRLQQQLGNIHDEVDRRTLETADVIGVTTTGLAKRISVLQHIKSKVILCEEAGEVLESHMLCAMLPSAEHIIQIGDHQQLRPQINNYKLSLESQQGTSYQLDRSQFERLSVGEPGRRPFPLAQLNVQRRMRPEISELVRATLYPRLIDHEKTTKLPNVVGMRKNVFWLDHENYEEMASEDRQQKSHSNLWEVDMTHALIRHIVRQGVYKSSDIAVLTPYTGQLQQLKKKLRGDFEIVLSDRDQETLTRDGFGEETAYSTNDEKSLLVTPKTLEKKKLSDMLRIGTVDNFQGEEAKVIIVSLVRSNRAQKVGFLRTTNRINVLLSRAQHGMYLIGNSQTYSNIPMWQKVINILTASDSIGKAFGLCCPRHTDTEIQVSEPPDFERLSPEGGCQLACDRRLPDCGHRCLAKCHSEAMHQVFRCPQPCHRLHSPCNHACQKATCGEDCGKCMIRLQNVLLPCGHLKDDVYCHQTQDLAEIYCSTTVVRTISGCNHSIEVKCSQDTTSSSFSCSSPCNADLGCGHQCHGTCGTCYERQVDNVELIKHLDCSKVCGRRFGACNHNCPRPCHTGKDCGLCFSPCEVRCTHSQCPLECHQACAPCIELCSWSCEHSQPCDMPCSAPCTRLPCSQRCTKTLACGHRCPSLCGETCPENYCQICSDKRDSRVDLLEMKTYEEIDLNESPVVVLGCGHFFTAETLDGIMRMKDVYTIDKNGEFVGLRDISSELTPPIPLCPDCQCPVRQYATQRYNRIVNRAVIGEMSKRFLVSAASQMSQLERDTTDLELIIQSSRAEIIELYKRTAYGLENQTPRFPLKIKVLQAKRHSALTKLEASTKDICKAVREKNTPARKLFEAIITAERRRASPEQLMAGLKLDDSILAAPIDQQTTLRGRMLHIRLEYIRLDDKLMMDQSLRSVDAAQEFILNSASQDLRGAPFFESCIGFIDECKAAKLPKLAVEASVFYGSIAQSYRSFCLGKSNGKDVDAALKYVQSAQDILRDAAGLCQMPFQNAENLLRAVEECTRILRAQWYEKVTSEEVEAIKAALVQGPGGIATHSGHWYNCRNGHPFAIGECGMPMEEARCPECGAPVGGQHHRAVEGVTRATQMEDP